MLRNIPIRRKLTAMILGTSLVVLVLTCTGFFSYEYVTFRQTSLRQLSTLGEMIAINSTAALAFDNREDAKAVLSALKAERHVVAAAIYDRQGRLFAKYPAGYSTTPVPSAPRRDGYRFEQHGLIGFQPIIQTPGAPRQGTLYIESDLDAMYQRFQSYGGIAALVIAISVGVAYALSRALQHQISRPVLALAETARAVSERQDYSVRANKVGTDELGLLTDAFNHMLARIEEQTLAVRESETRVRAVLDSALSAVVVIDAKGMIIDWNARAESMFGWTHIEALGRELAETIIPLRYREQHRRGMANFLATGTGPVLNRLIEISAVRRDGGEFPVELSINALHDGGRITFCGFITDITERKLATERIQVQLQRLALLSQITRAISERQDLASIFHVALRSIEDNLPIDFGCVCLYDRNDHTLTVAGCGEKSAAIAAVLALPKNVSLPIDENGLARCVRGELVYEPDTAQVKFPFPQRLAHGGLRAMVIAPLRVESNVFGVLVAARRDPQSFSSMDCEFLRQLCEHVALAANQAQVYSALQVAYEELRQTQQTVLQQERLSALGQMASGIAHDINNAISPISLYTESLLTKDPTLSERARDYLTTIQHAIEDVAQTVSRMREFYRPREPQLALAPVSVNRTVDQVANLTKARWFDMPQQRGVMISLNRELDPDLPPILGVESEIREALINLIFNAVDAMPEGGTLTLRTRVVEDMIPGADHQPRRRVAIEVGDSGLGMDEETKRRCLEPFFTTKGERGTGLGLAMVYGTVKRHGADIEVDTAPGRGTIMRLLFAVPEKTTELPGISDYRPAAPARLRLLLVDDDPVLLKSLRDTLADDGHDIVATNGGQAGIDAFCAAHQEGRPFAAVITDLGMPHIDGRRVAAAVKETAPDTPVFLLTGWGQRLVAESDIPTHVDRVLNKPPKLRDLREALATVQPSFKEMKT
jgi:PAS domain S-box-containing protein